MVAKCVIGACIVFLYATSVRGEEGNEVHNLKLAKYMGQHQPLQKGHKPLPQVKVKETFDFYDIDGTTREELLSQMNQSGTSWNDGKVYAALTTWDIRYHYDITTMNGRYYLSSIGTDVGIVFHLPRLVSSAKTPEGLILTWNTYLGNLKTHEFGHRDIAVSIGQDIYQTLSSLGSCTSKGELDHEAQEIVQAKFQHLKEAQIEYDMETRHGKKQGAVLMDSLAASSLPAT